MLSHDNPSPLFMMILGPAGTFLVHAIVSLLGEVCLQLVTVTTGITALLHVHGLTLHSALSLPVRRHALKDLQGSSLARFRQRH